MKYVRLIFTSKYANMVQSSVLRNAFRHKSLRLNEWRRSVHEETTWKNEKELSLFRITQICIIHYSVIKRLDLIKRIM